MIRNHRLLNSSVRQSKSFPLSDGWETPDLALPNNQEVAHAGWMVRLLLPTSVAVITLFGMLQTSAIAFAQSGSGNPRGLKVEETESSPRLWALLVGVDDYVMLNDLQFAGRDVQMLKKRLVSSGFSEERVFLLSTRETSASRQPFRSNVIDQLDYLR